MTGPEHYIAAEELLAGSSQPVPSSAVWIANPGRAIRQNHRPVISAPRSLRPCQSVQAIFSALVDMDPGKLEANGIRITPAERKQADELYLACSRAAVSGNAGSRPCRC